MDRTTVECSIKDFSLRGFGLGPHPAGQGVIEVAHAIPGDLVRVELMRKRHRIKKGRMLELVAPSSDRIEPRCKHSSLCGGCSWAAMAYVAQLNHKKEALKRLFGDLIQKTVDLQPMIPCEETYAYRNKMEFSFSENRAGHRFLGLMIAHAEPYVFNVEECQIAPPWMSACVSRVREWWHASGLMAYDPPHDRGTLRYLTLREAVRTGQRMAVLNISGNPDFALPESQIDRLMEIVGEDIGLFLRIHQTKKGTPTHFFERHLKGPDHIIEEMHLKQGSLRFKISPASFFQTNTRQAEKLYDVAIAFLGKGHSLVYDLYCGTGTLGIAAAAHVARVVGIELSPEAVLDARENAKLNGIQNIQFYQGDAGKILAELSTGPLPDAVLVDPPRAGLDERAILQILALAPQRIVYVSCNPITQAENIRAFIQAGYSLVSMQAVDQFPHTAHIENVALLYRSL